MRQSALQLVYRLSTILLAVLVFLIPLFFLPVTTEFFETPKQVLTLVTVGLLLLLFGVRGILEGKFSFRRSPFDAGLFLFIIVVLVSTISFAHQFPGAGWTAILSAVPWIGLTLVAYLYINSIRTHKDEQVVLTSLLVSGAILGLVTLLQFLKLYILPFPFAKAQTFNLAGSLLDTATILVGLLPLAIYNTISYLKLKRDETWGGVSVGTTIIMVVGLASAVYQLLTTAQPILLPQSVGLRTALQPLGLSFTNALFGTGPGTYLFDFTRFRDPILNLGNVWNIRFSVSSSLFLEVLATLGLVGALSILYIIVRTVSTYLRSSNHNPLTTGAFLSLVVLFILAFFLPMSYVTLFLIFFLLGVYSVRLLSERSPHVSNIVLSVVALKEGLFQVETENVNPASNRRAQSATDILPYITFAVFALLVGTTYYYMYQIVSSDMIFQKALVAASENKAKDTYDLQLQAINTFPNRDFYHRIFAQTNLAIANSIASNAQSTASGTPKQLSTEDQQNVVTLVQQSINFSRNATILSPLNVVNWENLSSTYRSLIGFAQNADQFSAASAQQAIALDPTNPLLAINLGGIYYQLGLYDDAIRLFNSAVQLKPDLANAHYNLGHAFEAKGDAQSLQLALNEYQAVKNLSEKDSENYKKITAEIEALQKKVPAQGQQGTNGQQAQQQPQPTPQVQGPAVNEPLQISTPSSSLPASKTTEVKVSPPPTTPTPTK